VRFLTRSSLESGTRMPSGARPMRAAASFGIRSGAILGSLLAFCSLAVFGVRAAQEDTIRISGVPTCDSCAIEIEEVTKVVSLPDVGLTRRDKIALDDDGIVWLVPFAIPHLILRYLPDGSQDLRISERGQGPREFLRIERIETGPENIVYVFGDGKLNRYTSSGEFLDTRLFPRQLLHLGFFPDGSMIVNASLNTQDRAGHIFHSFDPEGEIHRSFGPISPLGFERAPMDTRRRLAVSGADAFWAAPSNRYEVDLWDAAGARRRRVIREVDWFEPWTGKYEPPYVRPPVPRLWGVAEDGMGYLWVLLILPAEEFSPLPRPASTAAYLDPQGAYSPAFDIVVEVLDVGAGQVVAHRRFPNTMVRGGFLRDLHVVFTDVDEEREDQIFRITRLTLVR